MQPHSLNEKVVLSPLRAAAFEMAVLREWDLRRAVDTLIDMADMDNAVPASAMFTPDQVREFYAARGRRVNVVPLPR